MFKTLLKTIWSHLNQNKAYAAINIGGLAIGIGCSLVIYKIIAYESSFDSYHTNYENVYRLITDYKDPVGEIKYEEGQVPPVGEAIRNEFPGTALREAVANYQQKVLTAFQEVEDALVNNFATGQRVERLAETARATSATLRLSTDRYLAGLVDYLPVLTAQRTDFDVSSRLLAARRQLLADRISLARSLGGRWMQDKMNARLQIEKDKK